MNNEKCCLCDKPMGNSGSTFDNKPAHKHCIEEQTINGSVLSGRMQTDDIVVGEDKEPSDKNSMLYWFPKIKHLDILQPKTECVEVNSDEVFNFIDGGLLSNLTELFEKAKIIGYPLFLRSDQLSGKHGWKNTCFVEEEADLIKHLRNIAEATYCCDILGKPVRAFFFREYIPMKNLFTAFFGEMPVNPEIRFFIEDGEVKCKHWYWIEDSIRNPSIQNWKETLKKERESMAGNELWGLQKNARKVADCFKNEGFWSVDFCKSMAGEWALIDMAQGLDSWHEESCPNYKMVKAMEAKKNE